MPARPLFLGSNPGATNGLLQLLLDDLRQLHLGNEPDLSNAPTLEAWAPATRKVVALTGIVTGHPTVPDGHRALTSEIYAVDPRGRWARSLTRLYALGAPLSSSESRT